MNSKYEKISAAIQSADAILIGASNGLSISDGYHIFADNQWFQENFGDFRSKYGIRSLLQGMFLQFSCPEEQWAFYSRLAYRVHYSQQPSQMMRTLFDLVCKKDYFVVTSNGEDHFTPAGFLSERVFEMEGKLTEYRCANHCHDMVYNNREDVLRMVVAEKDGRIPSELLPKCPKCGGLMEPNLAGDRSFFQTEAWQTKARAYELFAQKCHGKKLVILEFGVGLRNQMIKAPLMKLAAAEPLCTYITFNKGELYIPNELTDKAIGVDDDIAEAIHHIKQLDSKRGEI